KFSRSDIANGGESGLERAARVDVGGDCHVDRAAAKDVFVIIARLRRNVRVAIDQARQDGLVFQVDDLKSLGHIQVQANGGDLIALDQDDRVAEKLAGFGVE